MVLCEIHQRFKGYFLNELGVSFKDQPLYTFEIIATIFTVMGIKLQVLKCYDILFLFYLFKMDQIYLVEWPS